MGLLDQLINQVGKSLGGGASAVPHGDVVTQLVNGLGLNTGSGLTSLIQLFEQKGLGQLINGWVSTGPNPAISPDQVTQALGADRLQQIATQLGVSPNAAASHVSSVLPALIDHLTPNGSVPQGNLLDTGLGMLKQVFNQ